MFIGPILVIYLTYRKGEFRREVFQLDHQNNIPQCKIHGIFLQVRNVSQDVNTSSLLGNTNKIEISKLQPKD